MDESLVAALKEDYREAPLSAPDRALLDYAWQVTIDATAVSAATVDGLRAHGFDDRAILQATLIAAWFNYVNRVADALGVGRT
ncbi:peroxidase [Candidatus Poribacteria bacterium]|nr:peroxidase [Candidatus Poribacteria bacterium]